MDDIHAILARFLTVLIYSVFGVALVALAVSLGLIVNAILNV